MWFSCDRSKSNESMYPTIYDLGRYLVPSESGDEPYLVDVAGEGWCDCVDHRIRVAARGEKESCKHVAMARRQFERDFPAADREQLMKQQGEE